jgi:S1-C subfamily serine protease
MEDTIQRTIKLISGKGSEAGSAAKFEVGSADESDTELLDAYSRAVISVASNVGPSVVNISIKKKLVRRGIEEAGVGSGVIIAPDGYILTNSHVIHRANELLITITDGTSVVATLVGEDPPTDLAVVRANISGLLYASIGDSSSLHVGQLVIAIGNPYGFQSTVLTGVISALGHVRRGYLGVVGRDRKIDCRSVIS